MGSFSFLATKYLITAALIVIISEVAKHFSKLGALIAALPTVTILVLIWLYVEDQSHQRIADHAWYTFWYVLPTLPMFLLFPELLQRFGFWGALGLCAVLTVICFGILAFLGKSFGLELI